VSYSSNQVADRAGITYRQLDYWERSGLVQGPSGQGSGYGREWSATQLNQVELIAMFVRAGISYRKIREILASGWDGQGNYRLSTEIVLSVETDSENH
jgi:DNA-binding transcriptional MerR regulator